MTSASEYGNIAWYWFVYGAYGSVFLALAGYTLFAWRSRDGALRCLKDEGFLSDSEESQV